MKPDWDSITTHIQQICGQVADTPRPVGGGCINATYVLEGKGRRFFVKLNDASTQTMFEAEAEGLRALAQTGCIRVPAPLCYGVAGRHAYLVMEHVALEETGRPESLGEALAALHCASPADEWQGYGWQRDNTIGRTPQINTREHDWGRFWAEHRLGFQLELAQRKGTGIGLARRGERLLADLASFFPDDPPPALLHGDLWSGNYGFDERGHPVIFDPAVYYGDRETDLAMTELFSGFPSGFYAAYQAIYPLDAGYAVRKTLYNLYHILNHFNLFGGGYLARAEEMMDCLLSELR
jgi:fructosamine-3-kinase